MADHSTIEWTDATWNPITGCTMVSAGCTNCYAMGLAATRLRNHPSRQGLTRESGGRQVWTGEVRFNAQWLDQPLRWTRPRRIFVCAHGDLFHEAVPDEWVDRVFAVMALSPQHTFQVLTKRPARARAYFDGEPWQRWLNVMRFMWAERTANEVSDDGALPNVWLGTSIEDQATADARVPELLATPAARRFVSAEPLLGPVDLRKIANPDFKGARADALTPASPFRKSLSWPDRIDWVIVGGESGRGARPMHPHWVRSLRDQCQAAGVAFFFKQWGAWAPLKPVPHDPLATTVWPDGRTGHGNANDHGGFGASMLPSGKKAAGRLLDGRTWDEVPA